MISEFKDFFVSLHWFREFLTLDLSATEDKTGELNIPPETTSCYKVLNLGCTTLTGFLLKDARISSIVTSYLDMSSGSFSLSADLR